MSTRQRHLIAASLATSCMLGFLLTAKVQGQAVGTQLTPLPAVKPKNIEINLDKAMPLPMPAMKFELKATMFHTLDNKQGWALKIPGGRPIATPAYANGMLYVGGGYGSHEFYAFDAETGNLVWQYNTGDDGPTAAVVEDGLVAFNTESCTVYVLDANTGKLVWQEWLGDPLMSQPAIYKGKLYIAYPGGGINPHHGQSVNAQHVQSSPQAMAAGSAHSGHRMLCADLKTGKHIWDKPITADVISAPVLDSNKVFFSCQDGTSFCMDAQTGKEIWKKADGSTSAPSVANSGKLFVTQKQIKGRDAFEKISAVDSTKGQLLSLAVPPPPMAAPYLQGATNGSIAGLDKEHASVLDAAVGFGGGAPSTAQMSKASENIAISSVAQGWAYQGSRAVLKKGMAFNAQGATIKSISDDSGTVNWNASATGKGINKNAQAFSPPALGHENMYLASGQGHLISIDQKNGKVNFMYSTNQPMVFQPALAKGNIYVGTSNGMLLCLKTGGTDADGWTAWGGNAQHNKKD